MKQQLMSYVNSAGNTSSDFGCCMGGTLPSRKLTATIIVMGDGDCESLNGVSISLNYIKGNSWYGESENEVCGGEMVGAGITCLNDGFGFLWKGGIICGRGMLLASELPETCEPFLLEFPGVSLQDSACCNSNQKIVLIITA